MLPEDMSQLLIINVESVIEIAEIGEKKKSEIKKSNFSVIFSREKCSLPYLF